MKTTQEDRLTFAYALVKIANEDHEYFRNIEFNLKEKKLYFDCSFHSIDTANAIAKATGLVITSQRYNASDITLYIF